MHVRKAFLSSTGKDLFEFRRAIHEAINKLDNWKCVWMEDFVARGRAPLDVCQEKVRSCDLLIGIVGHFYGSTPAGDKNPSQSTNMTQHVMLAYLA